MLKKKIPHPSSTPSKDTNEYSEKEFVQQKSEAKAWVIAERRTKDYQEQIKYFKSLFEEERRSKNMEESKHTHLFDKYEKALAINEKYQVIKRAKTNLYFNFMLCSVFMTIGGGLISTFPKTSQGADLFWFYFGWALILSSLISSFFNSSIPMFAWHYFIKKNAKFKLNTYR